MKRKKRASKPKEILTFGQKAIYKYSWKMQLLGFLIVCFVLFVFYLAKTPLPPRTKTKIKSFIYE